MRTLQCGFRKPHDTHRWIYSPSERVRCPGVFLVTAEEYNEGDYDGDFIGYAAQDNRDNEGSS